MTPVASPSPSPALAFLDEAKAQACIHCGLCLASCPTYLETGDENQSPRGRIHRMRALQDGRLALGAETVQPIDQCLGCRACEAVCPSGVQYGDLLEHTRDHVERHHRRGGWQTFLRRVAIEQVFPFPERLEVALAPARAVRALGLARFLPARLREALALVPTDLESVELPAYSPAYSPDDSLAAAPGANAGVSSAGGAGPRGRAGLLTGCAMRVMFGGTNRSTLELLNEAGYDVVNPADQGCCGALHAHGGQLDEARRLARRNIECFERAGIDVLVVNAAGCGSTLKEYGALLAHDPAWAERAARFAARVRDLTEVLPVPPPGARTSAAAGERVTYHDACHLCHAQRISRPPRDLVKSVAGSAYVELPEAEVCCGSAGTYNLTEPEMAARLQERKVAHVLRSGATTVVTTNPGCLLQIRAGLAAAGADHVEAVHLADYLRRAGRPGDRVDGPGR